MGVVRRQSIKRTTVSYLGVLIGMISVLKIYPLAFDIYGMSQFIMATAALIMPFASMGISRLTVRYFPEFRDDRNHHGFLGFLMLFAGVSFLVFTLFLFLFKDVFFDLLEAVGMKKESFWENRTVIVIISLALILNSIFAQYASNFKRIVVPEIFNNLFIKIALPTLVLLYFYKLIGDGQFRTLYASSYVIVMIGLLGYIVYLKQFSIKVDFRFITRPLFKEMMVYSAFNALSIIGYLLSFRIDNIMITSFIDYDSTGYYSFFSYMVNVIVIPYMSMIAISSPIIAQSIKDSDLESVNKLYRQSSETLFIVGLFIIGAVWICIDPLLEITNKAEVLGPLKYTFLILAAGQLINVTTGLTEPIIGYSKYYRFNLYTMAILAGLNIIMNFYFIPKYGIVGAAMATAISLICYSSIQCLFIYIKFGILPFSLAHFKVFIIVLVVFGIVSIIHSPSSPLLAIGLKGSIYTLLIIFSIIRFGVSQEVTKLWLDLIARMRNL